MTDHHLLTRQGRQAMQAVIDSATHTPGGYLWWHSLPGKGRHSQAVLTQKWAAVVLTRIFPQSLLTAMLHASLSPQGTPQQHSSSLYNWLIANVYNNKVELLYKAWTQLPK